MPFETRLTDQGSLWWMSKSSPVAHDERPAQTRCVPIIGSPQRERARQSLAPRTVRSFYTGASYTVLSGGSLLFLELFYHNKREQALFAASIHRDGGPKSKRKHSLTFIIFWCLAILLLSVAFARASFFFIFFSKISSGERRGARERRVLGDFGTPPMAMIRA